MAEAQNVTAMITPWVQAALERHGQGEALWWDTQYLATPDSNVVLLIVLWTPGPVLRTVMNAVRPVQAPSLLTEQSTTEVVRAMLEDLRTARSEALSGPLPDQNGQGVPQGPSGLILPGT